MRQIVNPTVEFNLLPNVDIGAAQCSPSNFMEVCVSECGWWWRKRGVWGDRRQVVVEKRCASMTGGGVCEEKVSGQRAGGRIFLIGGFSCLRAERIRKM